MSELRNRHFGTCPECGRQLLLSNEHNLCLNCELEMLRNKLLETELMLAECRRNKALALTALANERRMHVGE